MDPTDLDLRDLLTPAVQGGPHAFASHRVVLLHSGALWTLRQQLIDRLGVDVSAYAAGAAWLCLGMGNRGWYRHCGAMA